MYSVIVGAGGWAARAAESFLVDSYNIHPSQLLFFGSNSRIEEINSRKYPVQKWTAPRLTNPISIFMPFGFLTADKFFNYGKKQFEEENLNLIQMASDFIRLNKPEKCVIFSSGIVNNSLDIHDRHEGYRSYANMKIIEEEKLREVCNDSKTSLVICRLYSASGRHINDPNRYALGNFIVQAIVNQKIVVTRKILTYRRYVDLSQLIEICVKASENSDFVKFDSSGDLIEIGDLALEVGRMLDCKVDLTNLEKVGHSDNYYSTSRKMQILARGHNVKLFQLAEQIDQTIGGVKNLLKKNQGKI